MKNEIELTVLFPVHNLSAIFLDDAINSIFSQTLNNFEILFLVSEKIHSDFLVYINKFSYKDLISVRVLKIKLPGLAFALNLGLEYSNSEFIARMDSDDISLPSRFEDQITFIKKSPHTAVVGCKVILIDSDGHEIQGKQFSYFETNELIRKVLPFRNPLCHPALIFRKSVLFKYCGYQYGGYSEDHALFLKIARDRSNKFYNLPKVLFKYRRHDGQSTDFINSWNAFYEISGFLFTEFLRSKNIKYLIGVIAVYPPFRSIRNQFVSKTPKG